jgi:peptidyl-prolyl cis-trans isomerase A (cyclophilin A)
MKMNGMALLVAALFSTGIARAEGEGKWMTLAKDGKPLYAVLHTSMGDVTVKLFSADAPVTVANFVGLATGEKEWVDPKSGEKSKKPLYSGTIFHRVIPHFMVQGGDPTGTGRGAPGYRFEDEFKSGRKFDKTGILAMANAGPGTNGSQFFITVAATPWLNNHHTIFGEVISGYDVVEKIVNVPRNPEDKPLQDVVLKSVDVTDKAPGGKAVGKG